MVEHTIPATQAVVTLDVALPGIVWGWIITMNMWAKSIGTGVIFVGFYLFKKYPEKTAFLKMPVVILSIVFIHIFLLFTVLDLHQMFRFWHIFVYPHWTSAITVGAWIVSGLVGVLFLMALAKFLKKESTYDSFMVLAVILAIPVTLYTAGIMAESSARELWQMPTEMVQMVLAATLTGSATLLLAGIGRLEDEAKRDLAIVLGISAFSAFMIYMGEYVFGPMKAEEVAAVLSYIQAGGEYASMFWIGQTFAFIIPTILVLLSVVNRSYGILPLAAISAIAGLWLVKHVWLIIPQLLPMS
jgi:formate-dependent nitrite reductase membrane component NrfD